MSGVLYICSGKSGSFCTEQVVTHNRSCCYRQKPRPTPAVYRMLLQRGRLRSLDRHCNLVVVQPVGHRIRRDGAQLVAGAGKLWGV